MTTPVRRLTASVLVFLLVAAAAPGAGAQTPPPAAAEASIGRTPPRLSHLNGEASFWRPGATDWVPAQVNTALAPGDELYTGNRGSLELQVGGRAFVRAWGDTQLGLQNQEPDFLQFKVTTGHVSIDLRSVDPGRAVEIDTPAAAFTIDAPGYYRVDVSPERTAFITRRSGRATMTPAGGQAVAVAASEEIVLEGPPVRVQSFVAPALDAWDTWNYARTDELLDSMSARYVSTGVYGVDDLDHHGAWRVVPTYGTVWVPAGVPTAWAPYSAGHWVADPYYGWTWVDAAPWGWAPYHHGRWVFVNSYWAWAPGPIVVRPVYAPALVAFFGAPGVRVTVGAPFVSWVALGWGEPVIPWWGTARFVGRPWWAGWGGPRVVNNVVVNRTTIVDARTINVYHNTTVRNAVVAVREDAFGRRAVQEARAADVDVRRLEPVRGRLRVAPDASSFVAASGPAVKPPAAALSRPVVATRRPAARQETPRDSAVPAVAAPVQTPSPRIVPAPRRAATPPRAPFGASDVERQRPSPRVEIPRADAPRTDAPRVETPRVETPRTDAPRAEAPRAETPRVERERPPARLERSEPQSPRVTPQPEARRQPQPAQQPEAAREMASPRETPRALPGEPANRVAPWRREGGGHSSAPAPRHTAPAAAVRTPAPGANQTMPARPAISHGPRDDRGPRDEHRPRGR